MAFVVFASSAPNSWKLLDLVTIFMRTGVLPGKKTEVTWLCPLYNWCFSFQPFLPDGFIMFLHLFYWPNVLQTATESSIHWSIPWISDNYNENCREYRSFKEMNVFPQSSYWISWLRYGMIWHDNSYSGHIISPHYEFSQHTIRLN